jgi:predicted dinucleotide-binding enzyme
MRIGIVGAGMIGSTLSKLWVDAGHEVRLASRHPDELQPLVARLGTRATAGTPVDAAAFGEVVMLTVPLRAIPDLARELGRSLVGKVVLDLFSPMPTQFAEFPGPWLDFSERK